jgi:acyl-CoA synthetase (AMP-forming)/AMP-acid ligase II
MGLIGALLFSIHWRLPLVLMSPLAFMMRPWRWLRAISDYKGTLSPAPNFGYALATKRAGEADLRGLDLSSWRLALNGAEPVRHENIVAFARTFVPHGYRETAMFPVYGLAEASLALTTPEPGEPTRFDRIREDASILTCVGRAVPGHEVQVTDDDGKPVPDRQVGHVIARGPSIMPGYYGNAEATAFAIRDGWLWTGDLGFMVDGRLYITGREKDLVIVNGHNHHAEDIERVAETLDGVRRGRTVAFAIEHETEGREAVVLVCEMKERDDSVERKLAEHITEVVRRTCNVSLDEVSFVPAGTLPKTSSGKVQRRKTRELYLDDALVPASTSHAALLRVFARSAAGLLTMFGRRAARGR